MSTEKHDLEFTRLIQVPPEEVYYAFTQATAWQQWCCDLAQVDPRPDGHLYICTEGYCACGAYTALEENRCVAFTWQGIDEPPTLVEVTLEARDNGTQMTFAVTNQGTAEAWAKKAGNFEKAWGRALENLQAVLETGSGIQRRPLLGVMGGQDLTPEAATELGVPVQEGFQIFEPLEGMGAAAAGLQKDDVIVEIDSTPLPSAVALGPVMDKHQPGDEVSIVFYRGKERMTATLELSARPLPEVPPTAQAMGDALRDIYAQQTVALAELLAGMPESRLTWTPDAIKWSVKHVIAHLLTTERSIHEWLARLQFGLDTNFWASHDEMWVRAIADSYSTTAALLEALQQAQTETLNIVAALPETFVAHKGTYTQVGAILTQGLPYHTGIHFDQIRRALTEAQ
ncbi:MAG: SRPBCC domain-containing protein [Anaerolineae bacterium]|nr:SRPBCC domain-containing protein [Anaerolineae bacterium]